MARKSHKLCKNPLKSMVISIFFRPESLNFVGFFISVCVCTYVCCAAYMVYSQAINFICLNAVHTHTHTMPASWIARKFYILHIGAEDCISNGFYGVYFQLFFFALSLSHYAFNSLCLPLAPCVPRVFLALASPPHPLCLYYIYIFEKKITGAFCAAAAAAQ